jgi:hypothetical protein
VPDDTEPCSNDDGHKDDRDYHAANGSPFLGLLVAIQAHDAGTPVSNAVLFAGEGSARCACRRRGFITGSAVHRRSPRPDGLLSEQGGPTTSLSIVFSTRRCPTPGEPIGHFATAFIARAAQAYQLNSKLSSPPDMKEERSMSVRIVIGHTLGRSDGVGW